MRTRLLCSLALIPLLAAVAAPTSAIVIEPGLEPLYIVGPSIPLPDVNAADVAVAGASIFVGQGPFGAGLQSILRIDPDGSMMTVVDGLNALGGISYDVAGDRLLFTDNGGDLGGATSGDTVYALPNPRAVVSPIAAATLTLLPSGAIPFAQAVLALPGGDVLVGDAAGPGSGRVVKVSGAIGTNFITGLDYVAGLALFHDYLPLPNGDLRVTVGNVNGSFEGWIGRYAIDGTPLDFINQFPLSGALDQAADRAGNLYVTGGFGDDFTSTINYVVQAGASSDIASGFGFSSGITVDEPSQRILALDFGANSIETVIAVAWITPGGKAKADCNLEIWGSPYELSHSGTLTSKWTCTDGDPACDRDLTANGTCTYAIGTCLRVPDIARNPKCTPVDVDGVTVTSPKLPIAAAAVQADAAGIVPATAAACSEGTLIAVPADRKTRTLKLDAFSGGKRIDRDPLKLRCLP